LSIIKLICWLVKNILKIGLLKAPACFFCPSKSKKALTYKAFGVAGAEGLELCQRRVIVLYQDICKSLKPSCIAIIATFCVILSCLLSACLL